MTSMSISRVARYAVCSLAAFGLALSAAPPLQADDQRPAEIVYAGHGDVPLLDIHYGRVPRKDVFIRDHALEPRFVRIEPGQQLTWVSRSRAPSRIVFEREVAGSMVCHGVVNFTVEGDELRSAPIYAGEVASFCELEPGRYTYRIIRSDPLIGSATGSPARRLEGVIVVSGAS